MISWLVVMMAAAGLAAQVALTLDKDRLVINSEFASFLLSSPSSLEFSIVTCVGPYHSGKSFFLNQVGNSTQFPVGQTTNPTTKGMHWHQQQLGGDNVLLIDTEGMSATDTHLNHDAKLFTVAALFSDLILYNTMSTIDTAALDLLEMLARRARLWQLKARSPHFARLIWVVQAFTLKQVSGESATQWLHRILHQQRSGLEDVFSPLTAVTLRFPTVNLENVPAGRLRPEYVQDLAKFRAEMAVALGRSKPRAGRELLAWLQVIVGAINDGKQADDIPSIWEAFYQSQLAQARQESIRTFDQVFQASNNNNTSQPLIMSELLGEIDKAFAAAMQVFDRATFGLRTTAADEDNSQLLRGEMIQSVQLAALQAFQSGLDSLGAFVKLTAEADFGVLERRTKAEMVLPVPHKQLQYQFHSLVKDTLARWPLFISNLTCLSTPATALPASLPATLPANLPAALPANLPAALPAAFELEMNKEGKRFEHRVDLLLVKFGEENRKLWALLAQDTEAQALEQFSAATSLSTHCLTAARLDELLRNATEAATQHFASKLARFKLEPDFEPRYNSLRYKLLQAKDEVALGNSECIHKRCSQVAARALDAMSLALGNVVLPQSNAKLHAEIRQIEQHACATFTKLARSPSEEDGDGEDFSNEPGCRVADFRSNAKFAALVRRTTQANVDAVTLFFGQPLKTAKREAEALEVRWFHRFREDVKRLGLAKIAQQRAHNNRAQFEELVSAAVEHWLDTDMDFIIQSKRRQWYQDFVVKCGMGWIALVFALYFWRQTKLLVSPRPEVKT